MNFSCIPKGRNKNSNDGIRDYIRIILILNNERVLKCHNHYLGVTFQNEIRTLQRNCQRDYKRSNQGLPHKLDHTWD
jgi:hypothetical protein